MNKLFILFTAAILTALTACGQGHNHGKDGHDHESHKSSHSSHHSDENVKLDNGKKWKANAETTQGIAAMQTLLANYKTGDDVAALKLNLETEFKTIFKKCTMTGEAHEQLHNYLIPLKEKLEKLNEKETAEKVAKMQRYLNTYGNYFE